MNFLILLAALPSLFGFGALVSSEATEATSLSRDGYDFVRRASSPKQVFAHYMIGDVSQEHIQTDVDQAFAIGLTGFSLNVNDPSQPFVNTSFSYLFDYVESKYNQMFSLMLSMDVWSRGKEASDFVPLIKQYWTSPAWYIGPNGHPMLTTFSDGGWPNTAWQNFRDELDNNLYFIPDFDGTADFYTNVDSWWSYWDGVADGVFSWESAWPAVSTTSLGGAFSGDASLDIAVGQGASNHSKAFMMPLSLVQYKNSYNTNLYRPGDLNLPRRMEAALLMDTPPDFICFVSWNDGPDSHNIGSTWPEQGDSVEAIAYDTMSHGQIQPLLQSFISAYKGGLAPSAMQPVGNSYATGAFWYKSILNSASCPGATSDPSFYAQPPTGWESAQDQLSYAIVSSSGATLTAYSNGQAIGTHTLVAGLNYGNFTGIQAGQQHMELSDGDNVLLLVASGGQAISSHCPACIYNANPVIIGFNATTSIATGIDPPQTCTAAPTSSTIVGASGSPTDSAAPSISGSVSDSSPGSAVPSTSGSISDSSPTSAVPSTSVGISGPSPSSAAPSISGSVSASLSSSTSPSMSVSISGSSSSSAVPSASGSISGSSPSSAAPSISGSASGLSSSSTPPSISASASGLPPSSTPVTGGSSEVSIIDGITVSEIGSSLVNIDGTTYSVGSPTTIVVGTETISIGASGIGFPTTTLPPGTIASAQSSDEVYTVDSITIAEVGSSLFDIDGTTYPVGAPTTVVVGTETISIGSEGIGFLSTTLAPVPSSSGSNEVSTISADGIVVTEIGSSLVDISGTTYPVASPTMVVIGTVTISLGPGGVGFPAPMSSNTPGEVPSTTSPPTATPMSSNTPGEVYTVDGITISDIGSSLVDIGGITYTVGSQTTTLVVGTETISFGPGGLGFPTTTVYPGGGVPVALSSSAGPPVVTIDPGAGVWEGSEIGCSAPCTMQLPPLSTLTTLSPPPITTTFLCSDSSGSVSVSSMTVHQPPFTTDEIWFWPVSVGTDATSATFTPVQSVVPPSQVVTIPGSCAAFSPVSYPITKGITPKASSYHATSYGVTIQPQPSWSISFRGIPIPTLTFGNLPTANPVGCGSSCPKPPNPPCIFGCGGGCGLFGCGGGCGIFGCGGGCGLFGCHSSCSLEDCGGPGCESGNNCEGSDPSKSASATSASSKSTSSNSASSTSASSTSSSSSSETSSSSSSSESCTETSTVTDFWVDCTSIDSTSTACTTTSSVISGCSVTASTTTSDFGVCSILPTDPDEGDDDTTNTWFTVIGSSISWYTSSETVPASKTMSPSASSILSSSPGGTLSQSAAPSITSSVVPPSASAASASSLAAASESSLAAASASSAAAASQASAAAASQASAAAASQASAAASSSRAARSSSAAQSSTPRSTITSPSTASSSATGWAYTKTADNGAVFGCASFSVQADVGGPTTICEGSSSLLTPASVTLGVVPTGPSWVFTQTLPGGEVYACDAVSTLDIGGGVTVCASGAATKTIIAASLTTTTAGHIPTMSAGVITSGDSQSAYCFANLPEDDRKSHSLQEFNQTGAADAIQNFCNNNVVLKASYPSADSHMVSYGTPVWSDPNTSFENIPGVVYVAAGWAVSQDGCAEKQEITFNGGNCINDLTSIWKPCVGDEPAHADTSFGGEFVVASSPGCLLYQIWAEDVDGPSGISRESGPSAS